MSYYIVNFSILDSDVEVYLCLFNDLKEISSGKFVPINKCSFLMRTSKSMGEFGYLVEKYHNIYIFEVGFVTLKKFLTPRIISWINEFS